VITDPVTLALKASERALILLRVLDREHDPAELHRAARGVRHEVETAQHLLLGLGTRVVAQREGKSVSGAPVTSQAAARAIRTRSGSQRHRVLRELANWRDGGGLTDWQLQAALGLGANSERPRRLELVEAGYVRAAKREDGTPVTAREPRSGLACQSWEVTLAGLAALRQLEAGQTVLFNPTLDTP
jgi:hypothetical protein